MSPLLFTGNILQNVTKNSKNVADTFSRMAFDFDLSEDGESELPTIISRSKKVSVGVDIVHVIVIQNKDIYFILRFCHLSMSQLIR